MNAAVATTFTPADRMRTSSSVFNHIGLYTTQSGFSASSASTSSVAVDAERARCRTARRRRGRPCPATTRSNRPARASSWRRSPAPSSCRRCPSSTAPLDNEMGWALRARPLKSVVSRTGAVTDRSVQYSDGVLRRHGRCRRAGRRRRHHRHLPAVPRAGSGLLRAAARGRRWRRRHLVLEPLSRRALRLRELHLRLPVLEGAVRRVGVAGALRGAARDRALPQPRRRPVRPAPPHPVRRGGHGRPCTTSRRDVDGRRSATAPQIRARFFIAATGVLSVPYFPDVPGPRRLSRRVAPHRAAGRRRRSTSRASASPSSVPDRAACS